MILVKDNLLINIKILEFPVALAAATSVRCEGTHPQAPAGGTLARALSEFELPVLKASICQRVIYAESAAQGSTALELDPRGIAAQEIKKLVKELMNLARKEKAA